MKPKSTLRSLLLASTSLLAISYSHATPLYWDDNSTTAGAGATPTGTWGTDLNWNDDPAGGAGTFQIPTLNTDDLFFVAGPGAASGNNAYVVTVDTARAANSLTFQASGATTLSGGTSITLGNGTAAAGGITVGQFAYGSTANGAVTITTPVILNNTQTWTNNAANTLSVTGGINNNASTLTVSGTGSTTFNSQSISFVLSGTGGLTKTGSGLLTLGGAGTNQPTHTYSGDITINGGGILVGSTGLTSSTLGNLSIDGGRLVQYFGNTFTRAIGTGANQVQIPGGVSGFSGQGATGSTFSITGIWKWGDTAFNPTEFVLQDAFANADGKGTFSSGIDLNGAIRTIRSDQSASNIAGAGTFSGVISNSSGTPAGLIKTGPGHHILSNTNTYNGSTTITAGTLTANSTAALGNSSATNTLIFNGGTLRAGAAITSVATRAVTMTATGIIDNNGQAISIAGNIGGAGGLTKNSTGTLTLSGTNSYGGVTTVNAGTLAITKEAALASNTAANVNVKSGATLALNVDSAGTAGFSASNLTTLLANISVANTAAQGLQAGATLGIDTGTATGATFTLGSAIANSTGAFGGVINLNKLGAGTLVFDQANTYTGNTIISAGTIQYTDGVAAPTTPIVNNSAFTSNATGALIQGTNFGLISGTGTVAQTSAGTLTLNLANTYTGTTTATLGTIILSNALAIQNSALNTTGAGFVTLSGVTTPTFGGLSNSGTTRDLATVISSGYGSVTNLTLNPAGTVTYDGVIANGAAGMSLTKTGAGTQVLTGIHTYTGATNINVGTLTLSGTGSILPSAITLNGGGLTLTNTAAETGSGRVNDTSVVTSNGGTLTYTNTSGANVYAETIGSVTLTKGQMNFVLTNDQTGAGSQKLTINTGGIARTGATNYSTATFSAGGTGLNATKNMILDTGATPVPTAANQIIGPWATTGTSAAVQTKWAVYDASGYVIPDTIADTAEASWVDSTTDAWSIQPGTSSLTADRTAAAIKVYGASGTWTLPSFNLKTNGVFFSGANAMTIAATGTGALTTPSGGALYITAGQAVSHTISAPITNAGGTTTLVKSGSGTLILSAANNTYGGDTIVNAGTLQIGISGSAAQLSGGTYAGNIFIARGAALTLQGNSSNTLSGVISGDGNLNLNRGTTTLSGANTYTGATSMSLVATNALGSTLNVSSFNSVVGGTASSSLGAPTTVANGTIGFGGGGIQQSVQINFTGSSETTDRIINFQFNGNGANRTIDASGSVNSLLKFTSAPISNGATGNNIVLQGSTNGEFSQGLPFGFTNFTKNGAGTWTLGGAMGNTGTTTISAGTLILNGSKLGSGTVAVNGTSTLGGSGTIAGVVTVAAGANLSPGTSVGTLTFRNDLNISALAGAVNAGKLNYELGPIASSDKIVVAGTLSIGTNLLRLSDFNFTNLGGLQNGTYKLITSGAAVSGTLDTNAANLTGLIGAGPASGTLQINGNDIELVVTGAGGLTGYALWASVNAPSGDPDDDFDGDGVSNAVEFVLGGLATTNDLGKLPVPATSGGDMTFTFVRDQASLAPFATVTIEVGTDLVTWSNPPSPYTVGTNTAGSSAGVVVNQNSPGTGKDTVVLTVTRAPDAKKFARLKVVITP